MSADYRCHQPAAGRPAQSPMRTPPPRDHQLVSAWDSRCVSGTAEISTWSTSPRLGDAEAVDVGLRWTRWPLIWVPHTRQIATAEAADSYVTGGVVIE